MQSVHGILQKMENVFFFGGGVTWRVWVRKSWALSFLWWGWLFSWIKGGQSFLSKFERMSSSEIILEYMQYLPVQRWRYIWRKTMEKWKKFSCNTICPLGLHQNKVMITLMHIYMYINEMRNFELNYFFTLMKRESNLLNF